MKVSHIMTANPRMVRSDAPLSAAAQIMRDTDVGMLPVFEDDRLVGTVTDRDIVVRCLAEGDDLSRMSVRDAMSPEAFTVLDQAELSEAAGIMQQKAIRRLVVVSADREVVGIISLDDIAAGADDDRLAGRILRSIFGGVAAGGPGGGLSGEGPVEGALSYGDFLERVAMLGFIRDVERADAAIKAVLGILANRLGRDEAARLLDRLPAPLSLATLRRRQARGLELDVERYIRDVQVQFDLSWDQAYTLIERVLHLAREHVGEQAWQQLHGELPEEWWTKVLEAA